MLCCPSDQLKNKKFYKFHNATSHSTNEYKNFRQHIQRAIQQGRLKFDTPQKMKVDDNPFPGDQNMVNARQPMHFLRSTFCYASYALQGIGHVANFVMHSLKQVYIYVISIAWYCLNQV